jgi:hypothetical protein
MSLKIQDLYKYATVIQSISSGSAPSDTVLGSEAAEAIAANSVVRFNAQNKLVKASNSAGNDARIVGFTALGAAAGQQCAFYPNGAIAPLAGAVGSTYYLGVDGALTTVPVPSGSIACIRVGYAPSSSHLAVDLSIFYI